MLYNMFYMSNSVVLAYSATYINHDICFNKGQTGFKTILLVTKLVERTICYFIAWLFFQMDMNECLTNIAVLF